MTRNRGILGLSLVILLLLVVSGFALRREWNKRQARVERRYPLQQLKYCGSRPVTPCVVSFSEDSRGNMLVNFLTSGAFYPDFYLKIKAGEVEHIYVCEKADTFATSVYCTGEALPVGQVFQFYIFSLNEDVVLAQGNFPIIGIALAAPDVFSTPTSAATPPVVLISTVESTPSPSYPSYPGASP